jgi:hypothetical protein
MSITTWSRNTSPKAPDGGGRDRQHREREASKANIGTRRKTALRDRSANDTDDRRDGDIAGVFEGRVAAHSAREPLPWEKTQRHRRDRRAEDTRRWQARLDYFWGAILART